MIQKQLKKARLEELGVEIKRVTNSPTLSTEQKKAFFAKAETEIDEIKSELKTLEQAHKYSWGTEASASVSQMPGAADGGRIVAPSPMDMTQEQVLGLYAAAQARTPYSIELKPKSYRDAIQTKAASTEAGIGGSFGGQLPPIQTQFAVSLGYEPTRISDLLPGAAMLGPSATWLSHTANTNEVGIVAEAGSKLDLGLTVTENQVTPMKLAGTATCTLEVFQDTDRYGEGSFASWLPTELTRSLINAESSALLTAVNGTGNATFNGLLNVSGTLTRAMGTDSPLDCLAKAYTDLRVGAAFADPDLVLIHPATLGALRRAKDADGRYVLDLLAGPLNLTAYGQPSTAPANEPNPYSVIPQGVNGHSGNLWGANIFTTTQVAAGKAVVMSVKAGAGIFWQRLGLTIFYNPWSLMTSNEMFWLAEERVALSVPRPTAINLVTGLPTS